MNIDNLLDFNKKGIFDKLSKIRTIKINQLVYYLCNDVIDILSESPVRDKRLINDYESDEVVIRKKYINNVLRECRFFTIKGIERYLYEGKVFNYKNACDYFGVNVKNKQYEKWKADIDKILISGVFQTKTILKWLYEKRKSIKTLGEQISTSDLIKWLDGVEDDDINQNKQKWLLMYLT